MLAHPRTHAHTIPIGAYQYAHNARARTHTLSRTQENRGGVIVKPFVVV